MKTVTFNCAKCGREKTASAHRAKALKNRPRYCSRECGRRTHPPAIDRFWASVDKRDTGCWEWTAMRNEWGYGQFSAGKERKGKVVYVHRWAYEHFVGPIPQGKVLRHLCNNAACVNPTHLQPGTPKENSADTKAAGRIAKGDRRVTETQKIAVRQLAGIGMAYLEISRLLNLGPKTVRQYAEEEVTA